MTTFITIYNPKFTNRFGNSDKLKISHIPKYINGHLYRFHYDGYMEVIINGFTHNASGPARIWMYGTMEYWINGLLVTKFEMELYGD